MSERIFSLERNENGNHEIRTNKELNNQFVEFGMEGNIREQETKYGGGGSRELTCARTVITRLKPNKIQPK